MGGRRSTSALRLLVLMVMASVACTDEVDRSETSCDRPSSGAVVCVFATEHGPRGRLLTRDSEVAGSLGSFCWTIDDLGRCEDVDEIPELGGSVTIPSGSMIAVVGDAELVSVSVGLMRVRGGRRQLADVADLDLSAGSATLRASRGERVIEVFGRWEQGDGELYFPIEVT
jgi:hypothetical protein